MDWNEDGKKDLIVGDAYGYVWLLLNTGSNSSPSFSVKTKLKVGSGNLDVGLRAMPEVVDWNNDGKKDLLCGDDAGRVWLLLNTGTNSAPAFSSKATLKANSTTLDCSSRASPVVIDWNKDGKKDLLCGNITGTIVYYENVGTDAAPVLTSGVNLKLDTGSTLDVGSTSRLALSDWNEDGVVDILSGDYYGRVRLFLGVDDLAPTYSEGVGIVSAQESSSGPSELRLTWDQAQDETTPANQIKYNVYTNANPALVFFGSPVASFVGVTEGLVSGVLSPTPYYLGVRAQDAAGNEESNSTTLLGPLLYAAGSDVWRKYR